MDSVSSETTDSDNATNEEKPADLMYVGRENLQVTLRLAHMQIITVLLKVLYLFFKG